MSDWRETIDYLNTISDGAARLTGKRQGEDPWPCLARYLYGTDSPWIDDAFKHFPDLRHLMVAGSINKLFNRCPKHGCIKIAAQRTQIGPTTEGLGATVLLQFAQVLTRRNGKVPCSGCGKRIDPSTAKAGHRRYCQTCRKKKIPARHAARDYRSRRKFRLAAKERKATSS
jgi:hypothetical protein